MALEAFNIDQGYGVFSRGGYETARHSHYAIEIVHSLQGSFTITTGTSRHSNLKSAIIPPNVFHTFDCKEATCELLFLDPLSQLGTNVLRKYNLVSQRSVLIDPPGLNRLYKNGKLDILSMRSNARASCGRDLDFRISKCIDAMNSLLTEHKLTVSRLSKMSFLSESRLSHLFKKQLGISVHQCILWKKVLLAVAKSGEGYSLTECAHYVGFVDSAHLSKVFYKMFGINPFFVLKS